MISPIKTGPIFRIGIGLVFLTIAACAPRGMAPSPPPPAATTDIALQAQAETAFQKGEMHSALDYYQVLIQNFPDSPLVPQAFLKIGRIQTALVDDNAALDSYQQLLATYPESPEAVDARVEMLAALLRLGRNQEILDLAPAFANQIQGEIRLFRLHVILGDAYAALGIWDQAAYFYALALTTAPPMHQATLKEKMKTTVAMLQDDQINLLLGQISDEEVVGYLSFQQAANMAGASLYDDAVWYVSRIMNTRPRPGRWWSNWPTKWPTIAMPWDACCRFPDPTSYTVPGHWTGFSWRSVKSTRVRTGYRSGWWSRIPVRIPTRRPGPCTLWRKPRWRL